MSTYRAASTGDQGANGANKMSYEMYTTKGNRAVAHLVNQAERMPASLADDAIASFLLKGICEIAGWGHPEVNRTAVRGTIASVLFKRTGRYLTINGG
jgi:hypothetical protein